MRVAALFAAHDLRLVDVDEAALGEHDVRVAVASVGLCGSDLHFYAHGRVGAFELQSPLVLGHEAAGIVVETGPGVSRVVVGDRVAIEPGRPCGSCVDCGAGRYNLCRSMEFPSLPPNPGFLAERVIIPERGAHPLPPEMTLEEGALLEPLSVALHASDRSHPAVGDRVLVAGSGPIGVLTARVARAAGASGFAYKDWPARRIASAVHMVGLGKTVFERHDHQAALGLSERERAVLELIADGLTNPEIAGSLHISKHTVKEHSSAVYRKLGVRNRTEAVQRAQRLGLLG